MQQTELSRLLHQLITTWENEVVEFKQATDAYGTDDIGKYFSALANEANLRGAERGWLVFGVNNKTRAVVGTDYRTQINRLQSLKQQIAADAEPRVTFREIHELQHIDGRVLLFEIPAAPLGMPIAWKGHYYARAGESLSPLGLDKLDEIRGQTLSQDWSAQVVPAATLADLDETAVAKARESFARKYANRIGLPEVMGWPLSTFLDRARLTQGGQITRTALLLLGKAEAAYLLSPHPAQMTWSLEGSERAYEHFGLPFLLTTTALYQRIRNIQLRILPQNELVPVEVPKYDQKIVLEALHNCIAHQDYTQGGRILVTESPDTLQFFNYGEFLPGSLDKVLHAVQPEQRYRNACLANAMVDLDLMETMNRGVKGMFRRQRDRFFPLPDYGIGTQPASVTVTLYGRTLDERYVGALMTHTDLSLEDAVLLDQIQKNRLPPARQLQRLRAKGVIEGRGKKIRISAAIAVATGSEVAYVNQKGPAAQDWKDLVCKLLALAPQPRTKIDELLLPKLALWIPGAAERKKYIKDLLSDMARQGTIQNIGKPTRGALWALTAPMSANESG